MTNRRKAWIGALRLKTLPLAAGGIILGSFLPEVRIGFRWELFGLALLTAFGLQILSNLANDYGDFIKGTDNEKRIGPLRALQSGQISRAEMKKALIICTLITLVSGIVLLLLAFGPEQFLQAMVMLGVGLAAIWAAVRYTVGKRPYGYAGLGDIFVVIFFGLVAVWGVSYLYLGKLDEVILFPALSYGFLSAGVLNINNMRDIENDRNSNKRTLVVLLGANRARIYHFLLILAALLCQSFYLFLMETFCYDTPSENLRYLALLGFIPVMINTVKVLKVKENPAGYNPFLKGLSLSTFFQVLIFVLVLNAVLN